MGLTIPKDIAACAEDTDFKSAQMTTHWHLAQGLDPEQYRMFKSLMSIPQLTLFENMQPENIEYIQSASGVLPIRLVVRGYVRTLTKLHGRLKDHPDFDMKPSNYKKPVREVCFYGSFDLSRDCLEQLDADERIAVLRYAYARKMDMLEKKYLWLMRNSDDSEESPLDVQDRIEDIKHEFTAMMADCLVGR